MVLRGETPARDARPRPRAGAARRRRALPRRRALRRRAAPARAWWPWLLAARRRDRARDRRLVPLRQRPGPDRRERAGRGAQLHRASSRERRRPDHRATGSRPKVTGCRTPTSAAVRLRAVADRGDGLPKGSIVTIMVSTGKKKVTVPIVVGKSQLTNAVAELTQRGPEGEERRRALGQAVGHRHRPGPAPGHVARRGRVGADQLLEGAEAGRRAARRRPRPTSRRRAAAPGRRLRRRARRMSRATSRPGVVTPGCRRGTRRRRKGSTVTLSVSNGPQTVQLPDVTGQTRGGRAARP